MKPPTLNRDAVRLLSPLIGIQGRVAGRMLELIDVLAEGPRVALLDTTSPPEIRATQYGDPMSRQPRVLTLPVISETEPDAHPVLRSLLPASVLHDLRQLIRGGDGSNEI